MDRYVNYGCGWHAPQSWVNFDASPTLRFERIPVLGRLYSRNGKRFPSNVRFGDIVRGLPLEAGSCRGAYCSHVLEHLALADCRSALRNTHRLLTAGGTFRMVLPDLAASIRRYVADPSDNACSSFMQETMLGVSERPRGLSGLIAGAFGNSAHLWMWDYKGLAKELADAGFRDIRRADYLDSEEQAFRDVEQLERWDGCLGLQCRK